MAYQPSRTHQSRHYFAPPSHQSYGNQSRNTRLFALFCFHLNQSRLHASAYQQRAHETKDDAVESNTELFAGPDSDAPTPPPTDTLNLDSNGKPLTYSSAKRGDVSAKTAGLDTVKLLIHSVISGDFKWLTIDIADFYLGTPLPASRYEYLRIHVDKLPPAIIAQYNLDPLIYNKHVYFEIRKCMYGLPQAGKLSQTRLIQHLKENG
jgi:hypothetical protein